MNSNPLSWPGKLLETLHEGKTIACNLTRESADWLWYINRLQVMQFAKRRFPDVYAQLDGGDRRIISSFLEPDWLSNTLSLLGKPRFGDPYSEYRFPPQNVIRLLSDAFGRQANDDMTQVVLTYNDSNTVHKANSTDASSERWFFINGILTSLELSKLNCQALARLFGRPLRLIHNPTHGLINDLLESVLQKLVNLNTDPVLRAFVEIGEALCDPNVDKVVLIAHSQGTIIAGDVLDLIYASLDSQYFDRTNMTPTEAETLCQTACGTISSTRIHEVRTKLKAATKTVVKKLELYMFANAATRMRYLYQDEQAWFPHIESFANHHDIVARLGVLALDELHAQNLLHIDGPLFTVNRYGHLLNNHYLYGLKRDQYTRWDASNPSTHNHSAAQTANPDIAYIGSSIHDPVRGNPCTQNPNYKCNPNTSSSRLRHYLCSEHTIQN